MGRPAYRIGLTMRDEGCPKDYIPIYNLFTQEKYALPTVEKGQWCIGEKQLKKMRFDTYHNVKKRFDLCQSDSLDKFWNANVDAINSLGANAFANLLFFKEIATAMICFQTVEENKVSGYKRKMISWGIKDSIYREYYRSQRESVNTGNPPKQVSLYDRHKSSAKSNIYKLKTVQLRFDTESGEQIIKAKRNAQFSRFEFWCKANNMSRKDGIYKAMECLVESQPVDGLKELGAYERKCDIDCAEVLLPDTTINDMVRINIEIPKDIHMKMRWIIKQYNTDLENIGEEDMTIPKYIAQAIDLLNRKSPLRYSDPEAYKEYLKAKEAEEYNKEILK